MPCGQVAVSVEGRRQFKPAHFTERVRADGQETGCHIVDALASGLWWLYGFVAIGVGLWFWFDVAKATRDGIKKDPKGTSLIILRQVGLFAAIVLVLWVVTKGGKG